MKYKNSIDIQTVYYESIYFIVQYVRIRNSIFNDEEHSIRQNFRSIFSQNFRTNPFYSVQENLI